MHKNQIEDYIKKLNSKNITVQTNYILGINTPENDILNTGNNGNGNNNKTTNSYNKQYLPRKIIIRQIDIKDLQKELTNFRHNRLDLDSIKICKLNKDERMSYKVGDDTFSFDFDNIIKISNYEESSFNKFNKQFKIGRAHV